MNIQITGKSMSLNRIYITQNNGENLTGVTKTIYAQLVASKEINPTKNNVYTFTYPSKVLCHISFVTLVLPYSYDKVKRYVSYGIKSLLKKEVSDLEIIIPDFLDSNEYTKVIGEAIILSNYSFDKYKSQKNNRLQSCFLLGHNLSQESLTEGLYLGKGITKARDISTDGSDVVNPESLSEYAKNMESVNLNVTVMGLSQIEALGMRAFLAVGKSSQYEPRLVVMEYKKGENKPHIGLVGKGITFDSGGYSMKPSNSMLTMQGDMSGAASVIALMEVLDKNQINCHVTAVMALCENMVSSTAYKPNDIIKSRSGQSIFITNTDAEGRLTLIDAVDYIVKEKNVEKVIDIATLTGAAEIALGQKIAPVISNDDNFYKALEFASKKSGERVWRLPNDSDFMDLIKSPYADLDNSGGRYGGTITAGMFIGTVTKNLPWLHIDIAGPSWSSKDNSYYSEGGTGFGTKLLYELIKQY